MLRPVVISIVGVAMILVYGRVIEQTSTASFIISCVITEAVLIADIWYYGLNIAERDFMKETVLKKILKKRG